MRHVVPTAWKTGLIEVAPRVFAYVQTTGETGISNAGFIVGTEDNAVIDPLMVPSMTARMVAATRKVNRKPVKRLINTHHHIDHVGGNSAFPDAVVIATEKAREAMSRGFLPLPVLKKFMPRFAGEFAKLKMVLPQVTFKDDVVVHDGDREIRLWHPGKPAHSFGDAIAYLPREKVMFAGDLAFYYVTPLAFQGHLGNWITVADRMLKYDVDTIVPGHGPIGTKKDLKYMRDYLSFVHREARKRFDAGVPEIEAAHDIKLGIYASWREAERVLPNVVRCYQEFRNEADTPMPIDQMLGLIKLMDRGKHGRDHVCI